MNRRVILIAVFLMIFSLAIYGCGGGGSSDDASSSNTQTETNNESSNNTSDTTTSDSTSSDTSTDETSTDETASDDESTPGQTSQSGTGDGSGLTSGGDSDETMSSDTSSSEDSTPTAASGEVNNPNRIVYTPTTEILDSLDPAYVYDSGSGMVIFNIYDFLVFYDGTHPDQFVPMVSTAVPSAENGLITNGGRTYEFPIRTGIEYHYGPVTDADGNVIPGSGQLTAEDVAYSIQRAMLQDRAGGPTWMLWESFFGPSSVLEYARQLEPETEISRIEDVSEATLMQICEDVQDAITVDAESVMMQLREPFAPFLQIIAGYWGAVLDSEFMMASINDSASGLQKAADWDGTCENWVEFYDPSLEDSSIFEVANGTGPFMLERWRKEEELVLNRNDNYWRERPAHLEQVVIQATAEWPTRLLMLQEGDSDFLTVRTANRDQLEPLIENGEVRRYVDLETNAMYFIKINQQLNMLNNPYVGSGEFDGAGIPADFFADADVRKGFAYIIDYITFRDDINGGDGRLAKGPIPSTVQGFNPEQPFYSFNLDKAEEHFRAAMDGQLWETGFTFTMPYVPGASVVPNFARLVSLYLAEINPKFVLEVRDFQGTQITQDDEAGKVPFDFSSWAEDYHDAHNWVFPIFHSRGYYALTMSLDPEMQAHLDELIIEARTEPDQERRNEIYREIQRINYDEALMLPLVEVLGKIYMRSWVEGFIYNSAYPNNYYFWHYNKGGATN